MQKILQMLALNCRVIKLLHHRQLLHYHRRNQTFSCDQLYLIVVKVIRFKHRQLFRFQVYLVNGLFLEIYLYLAGGATTAPDRSQSYVLTTREAYNELMDMYAEMLRGSTSIHSVQQQQQQQQQSNNSEASDVFVSRLIRSALSSSGTF